MSRMKVGDVFKQLLKWNVKQSGASNYHDQFGHILVPAFLTGWHKK